MRKGVGRWMLVGLLLALGVTWTGGSVGWADELEVEGLPEEPAAYKAKVEGIIAKVDQVINKLKGDKEKFPLVADLMMTRDNVMREIYKVQNKPDGSKWGSEMRESVDAMLHLLALQYEKATS